MPNRTFLDNIAPLTMPALASLDSGKTPAEWVELLAQKGIVLSERSLREMANTLKARVKIGRTMLITPEHMETILKDGEKCRLPHTSAVKNGGPRVVSNTKAPLSHPTTNAARELLQSKLHTNGAGTRKSANDDCTSSVRKRKMKKGR